MCFFSPGSTWGEGKYKKLFKYIDKDTQVIMNMIGDLGKLLLERNSRQFIAMDCIVCTGE